MSDLFSVSTVSLHVLSLSFLVEQRYRRSILTLVRLYTSSIVSSSCTSFSEKSRILKKNDSAEPFGDVPLGKKSWMPISMTSVILISFGTHRCLVPPPCCCRTC